MTKDIRQSELFSQFMNRLDWTTDQVDKTYIYFRKFPLIGFAAKIPRPHNQFSIAALHKHLEGKKIFQLRIAPFIHTDASCADEMRHELVSYGFHTEESPFNPTTTILIDLTTSAETIFQRFTPAKRRAVRRGLKHGIHIRQSDDIEAFIQIRKQQYRPLGFLISKETRTIFETFSPRNATLLLAYPADKTQKAVAGILLLYFDKIAYYWFASALPIGKKLFAPTLLVWEALQIAKTKGCTCFDFEGIYDERFPKAAESWKGFTKFKEGFGGNKVIYMENYSK
jgi:lipid II:glycine glycyltransferase (peptidoglycan interpeptide bridge formation enzyme)